MMQRACCPWLYAHLLLQEEKSYAKSLSQGMEEGFQLPAQTNSHLQL